jgi:hypothetical protein
MNPMNPGGPPPGYPPQGPAQGYPQGAPQQGAPQGYGQGAPQGYPQGAPQGYPQGAPQGYPQGAPQGYPQGAPQGYPQGAPQGYPQGAPQGYPQGAPQGYPQGAPQGYPQGYPMQGQPQGASPYPGQPAPMAAAPVAGPNPYAQAQSSLKTAGSTLRVLQIALAGLGALMVLGGVGMMFTLGVGAGSTLVISGVVTAATGWFMLPQFMGQIGGATAMVDALAAKQQLAMTGIPAQARLLSVQQTGAFINMNPQVQAVLEIQGPQGVYQTQTTAVVPQIAIPRFQPGAIIPVRINPQNPHDVAVVV